MVKYKISKELSQAQYRKCSSRFGCWSSTTYSVKIITSINCQCCSKGHRETVFLCTDHIKDPKKFLPQTVTANLYLSQLEDPIINELFVKI
jgi:hypothetical protein